MVQAGDGYRFHVTGLTHDERGYPGMTPPVQDQLVRRLKSTSSTTTSTRSRSCETDGLEDAEVVVVSYGITSRVAQRAIDMARAAGMQGRQVPPHFRLAVPGEADSRTGRAR